MTLSFDFNYKILWRNGGIVKFLPNSLLPDYKNVRVWNLQNAGEENVEGTLQNQEKKL